MLLSGIDLEINVEDLRKFTRYKGYVRHSPTVKIFWAVFSKFSN
jgi:hypothetical protein